MHKSLLLIAFVFLTGIAAGQTVCLTQAQYETTAKTLAKEYTLVDEIVDPGFRKRQPGFRTEDEMEPGEKKRLELNNQFGRDLNQALKQANRLQDTTCYLVVSLYANPDGSVNRVYYRYGFDIMRLRSDSIANARMKERMDPFLCQWFSTYRFPITGDKPYLFSTSLAIGKLPSKRKLRRGKGIMTTLAEAEKTTRPDTVKNLVLNTLELKEVPEVIYRFPNLEVLDLSINNISEIPERVFTIPKLSQLNVSSNPLGNAGLRVARNKHLKMLNIQSTKITAIPQTVTKNRRLESLWVGLNDFSAGLNTAPLRRMRRLKDLNLYRARLNELPGAISRLKRLEVLDLYYNNLRVLPERLCRLKRLQQLAISNNKLNELPQNLGRMRKLQVLYTHHNFLGNLPANFEKLYYLRILGISHNVFATVPESVLKLPNLEELDLSHNRLTDLPTNLPQLNTLKKLYVRGNPVSEEKTVSTILIKQLESNKTEVFY
ncbi:leucine-rich repeat domain-containing protein [Larkinella terrae]|uniref:Leucine-rich repeat domain-containing protein n=1 Tax=Larkinella terrae TaxID=2025311 RepID=A0A7K0EPZ0_9BACT|nr:leucine-rich repeat domain-containing protein [Larkinella terrae]MRS63874.1 leucine-rich repeat domain-containing protein [Larkinella terrae]